MAGGDEALRLRRQLEVDAHDIGALAEAVELRLGFVSVGGSALERCRASPSEHVHSECPSVAGDEGADVPVADDPERASAQLPADGRLPRSGTKRSGVGDDAPGRGEDQGERQLGGSVCRPRAGADDDSAPGALCEVDVGHSPAGLADQPQIREERQQGCIDRCALADQDQRLRVADLGSPLGNRLRSRGLHDHVMALEKSERVQPLDGPLVVLHHDDAHPTSLSRARSSQGSEPAHRGRDPAWLLRFRLTLSRPAVSSFTPR